MDDLQYVDYRDYTSISDEVLNLVINGWPSIHQKVEFLRKGDR